MWAYSTFIIRWTAILVLIYVSISLHLCSSNFSNPHSPTLVRVNPVEDGPQQMSPQCMVTTPPLRILFIGHWSNPLHCSTLCVLSHTFLSEYIPDNLLPFCFLSSVSLLISGMTLCYPYLSP